MRIGQNSACPDRLISLYPEATLSAGRADFLANGTDFS